MDIKVPVINQSFYNDNAAKQNLNKIDNFIRPKYGKIIDRISAMTNVPVSIIESFIFIESDGDENAKTPYAVGLMQLSKASASDTIVKEKVSGRLTNDEAALLKKYLGEERWNKVLKAKTSIGTFIESNELFNPEFNILVGSLLLGQLIDEFTENGKPRLDKVVVVYNRGRYDKVSKKAAKFSGSEKQMLAELPSGTQDYVLKLVGTNGTLDMLT